MIDGINPEKHKIPVHFNRKTQNFEVKKAGSFWMGTL